ncbi:MAG: SBBP repeat-containing protein, partial [Blastocatellia bacterium]
DQCLGVATDAAGNVYVAGVTSSFSTFPLLPKKPVPSNFSGVAFVSKLDPTGSTVIYSTILGGSTSDSGAGIAVDSAGCAYVTGQTASADFPTVNAAQPTIAAAPDAFIAKLSADGSSLVYSTFLGGSNADNANAIAVDSVGNAYITGQTASTDFPTKNALQSTNKGELIGFVAKFGQSGALVYSTYLGGTAVDTPNSIAVDSQGSVYVTGATRSLDFPLENPMQSNFDAGTLIRSGDSGASWSKVDSGSIKNFQIRSIAVDPLDSSTLFVGTDGQGIFKSNDAGRSWAGANNGIPTKGIIDLAIDPSNPSNVYAFTGAGVFKSVDAGQSWRSSSDGLQFYALGRLAIDPSNPSTIYVGSQGVYKSTDAGASWNQVDTFPGFGQAVTDLAVDPKDGRTIYLVDQDLSQILRSTDGGGTWTGLPRLFGNP